MSIETVTEIEDKSFHFSAGKTVNKVSHPNARLELKINMDRDVITVKREVYNLFMLLGDVGGLFGLFVTTFSTIIGFINYQKSSNLLVSDLF